ncbi:hypothetical protein LCGC14_2394030 [marine sediment metagenome]|uniref:Uncharacterized protein n=1 Tax=marine sediment metagenome TaxID=412755 RepID=A0A0F9CJE3_9ZZZZ
MAENEKCISRVVSGEGILAKSVDHHEWRLLKESVPEGMRFPCYTYYCIFCLKIETKKA